ncbi:hypothetical protein DL96DRAFT_1628084, partial [Flagelloscypha sp. PMI_526]
TSHTVPLDLSHTVPIWLLSAFSSSTAATSLFSSNFDDSSHCLESHTRHSPRHATIPCEYESSLLSAWSSFMPLP